MLEAADCDACHALLTCFLPRRRILACVTAFSPQRSSFPSLGVLRLSPLHAQDKVLRVVPHSNLNILDPIWTTQYMARNHGYMVYDTLFGTDEKSRIQPQMVDKWTVSPDQRLWTFTLRGGPRVPRRQAGHRRGRDRLAPALGQARRDGPEADDLRRAHGLAQPDTLPHLPARALRLRARGARQALLQRALHHAQARRRHAGRQADRGARSAAAPTSSRRTSSSRATRRSISRNDKYVPRKETPSGTAGGKHVYVDRVEWNLALRDAQSQVNALANGEVDVLERPAFESYEQLKNRAQRAARHQGPARLPVHVPLQPPAPAVQQRRRCARRRSRRCSRSRSCARRSASRSSTSPAPRCSPAARPTAARKGSEIQSKSNMKKAQELVKASGYDGTPVVIIKPTDLAAIQKLPDVAAQLLRQAGFKVDLQAMDWNTVVSRRAKKDPPAQGGWNIFFTAWVAPDIWNPLTNAAVGARGREVVVRLAERRADREAARPVRARDRRGEEEGARRGDPGARLRDRHARAARRVRQPARHAQEHHRLGDRPGRHLLER